jgi:AGCS family alanine or glycine:cation symporter
MEQFFQIFLQLDEFLWSYIAIPILMIIGIWLTLQSRFAQVIHFPDTVRYFFHCMLRKGNSGSKRGISPLQAFFASMGGCIGIGNLVGVCTAVQIGGPGAILWMWVAALFGMVLKYAEVYLGIKYRVANYAEGYDGGPMYFLPKAFPKAPWLASLVALLLCIYSVEVFMFDAVCDTFSSNWNWDKDLFRWVLLALVLWGGSGGIKRVGVISEWMIPLFLALFLGMGLWVFFQKLDQLGPCLSAVFGSAFTSHAPLGAFAGSTIAKTIEQGIARGCYTGDVGIGYASIIQSEASSNSPHKQASLAIFGIFLDTFVVCSFSVGLILVTDLWKEPIPATELVQAALSLYFPHMEIFLPIFLFLLGYSTMVAFFCVGIKCAKYLSPKYGSTWFYLYACAMFILFSARPSPEAFSFMATIGALLLVVNTAAIFRLRKEISFDPQ